MHYGKIWCPEYLIAPLHIVVKRKGSYFASNSKGDHAVICSHYSETISNSYLQKILSTKSEQNTKTLDHLVESGINSALRIILYQDQKKDEAIKQIIMSSKELVNRTSTSSEQVSIKRIHIKSILRRRFLPDESIIVYGKTTLVIKPVTNKMFLGDFAASFCVKEKEAFSVYLKKDSYALRKCSSLKKG